MKLKIICLVAAILTVCALAISCAAKSDAPKNEETPSLTEPEEKPGGNVIKGVAFIDALSRELDLPGESYSIIAGDDEAEFALNAFQYDKTQRQSESEIVIFMGEADIAMLDELSEAQGKAAISLAYDELSMSYLALGSLLGKEQAAQEKAEYIESSLAVLNALSLEISSENRERVYLAGGADGLVPINNGELVELAGGQSVADGADKLSIAELSDRQTGHIIFEQGGAYEMAQKEWLELEAVNMGLIYEAPNREFNWINPSHAPDKIFAAKWLASLLYPEQMNINMEEETRMYYDLFYNKQFALEDAAGLLKNSSLKTVG